MFLKSQELSCVFGRFVSDNLRGAHFAEELEFLFYLFRGNILDESRLSQNQNTRFT